VRSTWLRTLNRTVALKFLPHYLVADEDAKARFKREAQAAAGLKHPNIVTIHEVGEYEGRPFFVMEHCEGQSLRDLLAEKTLSVDRIVDFAIQICEGLHEAHSAGVIHRDVKPSNIVIDKNGRPKLVDFGLAAVRGMEKLTKTGSTLGTVGYMSPEQIEVRDVDQRSDLFSFGVLLYEMITGRTPFPGETEAAVIKAVLGNIPEPLARYKSDVPEELQRIVAKLLEKNPEMRYQSAAGILPDLKRLRQIRESGVSFVTGEAEIPSSRKKLWRILVPTSALVLIILLVLILKPWKFEITPTQEAAAEENRLAIMYFDNLADPEDNQKLGEIATNLLITDLSESRYVQVVSSQRLYDILKQLGREGEKKIDRSVASQIAEKARAQWMLLGSILKVEPQIILTAQLVEVATGNAIASQRIEGEPGEEIFSLVDKLTVEIKSDLALPDSARAEPDRPVAEVTTNSPAAYRHYLEGVDYGYRFYRAEARESFEKALEYDSTFAMAYYWLSSLSRGLERRQLSAKAVEFSEHASQHEKWYIHSWDRYLSGDHVLAIETLQKIVDRRPDDKEAWFAIGYVYENGLRQTKEAIGCFNRAIKIDSLYKPVYNELAYAYNRINDFEKSIWAINKYISLAPDEPNPYDSRGELYACNGNLNQAIESYRKAVEIKPDFYSSWESLGNLYVFKRDYAEATRCYEKLLSSNNKNVRSDGRQDLAFIPMYRGKFDEALAVIDQGIAADRMERVAYWPKLILKSHVYAQKGELEKSLTAMKKAIADHANNYPGRAAAFQHIYIQRLSENGEYEKAQQVAQDWRLEIEEQDPTKMDFYWIGMGCLEFGQDNYESSIGHFLKAAEGITDPLTPYGFRVQFMLARAYQEAGHVGEAVAEFEKILANYGAGRIKWSISSVKTHYYLGLAYEQSGWKNKAIRQYEEFLEIWEDADPGMAEIDDAKQRLARLKSES